MALHHIKAPSPATLTQKRDTIIGGSSHSSRRLLVENKTTGSFNGPISVASAQALWERDKKEFALWALSLVGAKQKQRGSEVEGILGFVERGNKKQKIIVQVKGDKNLVPGMIDNLIETVEKEGAAIGLLISLHKPRLGMITDSVHAGSYQSGLWNREFLKIQIRTVHELLEGKTFDIPQTYSLLKKAPRKKDQGETAQLL